MLDEHLGYVADPRRIERFRAAIAKVVKSGDRVADLGCGSGILGLLSLQAGASRVIAVDDSAMIDVARDSLLRAGYGERAAFIRGRSKRIELPERVDVVICDHVGYFGFDYEIIGFLEDARKRFLKPAGTLIPSSIRLNVAAVGSQQCYDFANGWQAQSVPEAFHWLRGYAVNTKHAVNLVKDDVLGSPAVMGEIDLYADHPNFLSWSVELRVDRDGPMHGLAGWFECKLAEGVWMTNSPLADMPIRRPQAFLPIGETVQVKAGDAIKSTISLRPVDNVIAWIVEFPATGQRFSHSTWQGMLLSPEDLIQANPNHVPRLSREGQARMTILGYCDGKRTAQEIGQAVLRDHPEMFPSSSEISDFVLRVLGRDTA
ncbi:MAG: 50S ribosomal protein L11 methyltransferase [Burkholderiales bacterium]|nr:50S ribosomal protein L11 methyltransferase [Burkholderiales bacterium]